MKIKKVMIERTKWSLDLSWYEMRQKENKNQHWSTWRRYTLEKSVLGDRNRHPQVLGSRALFNRRVAKFFFTSKKYWREMRVYRSSYVPSRKTLRESSPVAIHYSSHPNNDDQCDTQGDSLTLWSGSWKIHIVCTIIIYILGTVVYLEII